jgi:linoleate 10R-lipoxygenase
MRAFPGWYEYNTVYAMFPFTIPSENRKILTTRGVVSQYSFKPPTKPQAEIVFSTAGNVKKILGNQKTFNVIWGTAISRLTGGVDFMLSGDKPANSKQHVAVAKAIYNDVPDWMEEVWDFYTRFTEKLIHERSYLLDEFYQVDAVRE